MNCSYKSKGHLFCVLWLVDEHAVQFSERMSEYMPFKQFFTSLWMS